MTADSSRASDGVGPVPVDLIKSSAPYLLTLAARLQAAIYANRTAACEVSPAGTYILYELSRTEPLTSKALSQQLSLGPAAIGQTLTRLERDGLITRDRAAADRRWVEIRLTPRGRAIVPPLNDASMALIREIRTVLGVAGERRFVGDLETLIGHFSREAEDEGALHRARATARTGTEA
ncbi:MULTISPECIES: MarR family winged helix-turn-helix transcriptional regulator [Sphingobium]|uniref:MarR family winged helix-turn-helix transcriptional regulator n=1 Tax=Sphingobium sp. MI1205 TaxID=407020 RepID=UPI0007701BFC|nr:MarR family transcriptional regulator [Sphingobium sp. MI1205]AMK19903.1 Transcriptional regulator, MarR family protein [Sphingobium sp. MI1205]